MLRWPMMAPTSPGSKSRPTSAGRELLPSRATTRSCPGTSQAGSRHSPPYPRSGHPWPQARRLQPLDMPSAGPAFKGLTPVTPASWISVRCSKIAPEPRPEDKVHLWGAPPQNDSIPGRACRPERVLFVCQALLATGFRARVAVERPWGDLTYRGDGFGSGSSEEPVFRARAGHVGLRVAPC